MRVVCALVAMSVAAGGISRAEPAAKEKWVALFDGRSLAGWTPKIRGHKLGENFGDTFRVEDGLLKVRYDRYDAFHGAFGHLAYKRPFTNYRLRVQYRFVGEQLRGGPDWALRNSGVMIFGQKPSTMGIDQEFPVSIEVQLLGGAPTGDRPTASVCTPGTNVVVAGKLVLDHCITAHSRTYRGDEWVTVEVEVHGGKLIRHTIDGITVVEYAEPQLDERDPDARALLAAGASKLLDGGYIYLQSESHPIDFRTVEIQELPR